MNRVLLLLFAPLPFCVFHVLGFVSYYYWPIARTGAVLVNVVGLIALVICLMSPLTASLLERYPDRPQLRSLKALVLPWSSKEHERTYIGLMLFLWWPITVALWWHLRAKFGFPSPRPGDTLKPLAVIYGTYTLVVLLTPIWLGYLLATRWFLASLRSARVVLARVAVVVALLVAIDVFFAAVIQLVDSAAGSNPTPMRYMQALGYSTASLLLLDSPTAVTNPSITVLLSVESLVGVVLIACLLGLVLTLPGENVSTNDS